MAGELWQEHGLVFASRVGTPLSTNNVIRAFRIITKKAGLGEDWVPREMRHTFVSVLSANGVPAAWSACGTSSGQDHSGWAGIMEANEQVTFPPLPCDRYPAAGHPLPDLPPHRGVPARQPQ